jgi:hypothetical protein
VQVRGCQPPTRWLVVVEGLAERRPELAAPLLFKVAYYQVYRAIC